MIIFSLYIENWGKNMVREKVFLVQIFLLLTISVFADAKPKNQNFWKEFSEISKIYRPSKGEQKVAKYILNKGLSKGFKSYIDKSGNVLIEVPATSGSENLPGIILQSHMDMVCIAKKDSNFEWGKNQIEIYEDKGWLCSKNTTLGADNGVGVAAMLDVLNSPPKEHGPLQLLFTVDEEGDFTGVCSLQAKQLKGKFLLNLDSEEAGEFNVGCAG
jgi:dipeptidase D